MSVFMSRHWTDAPHEGARRRTIENWRNYRTPGGLWLAANADVAEQSGAPPDWSGTYDFTHANLGCAMQSFLGDSTDPSNTALWGMRLSDRPGAWVNYKAVGIDNASAPVVDRAARTATWVELWNNCDLRLTLGRHKVTKEVVLKTSSHQASFRFALRLPNGFTHQIVGNSALRILDGAGVEVFRSPPVHGFDAAGKSVRVSLVAAADLTVGGKTFPTVRVVPNPTDLAAAQYPVTIDPTTTISGTTDLEDGHVVSGAGANNSFGGSPNLLIGLSTTTRNALTRVRSGAIPSGTINSATWNFYATGTAGCVASIYRVAQANAWVEGTGVGATQVGSFCWNYSIYNTIAWAGSAGCSTSGTDYEADASPPTITGDGSTKWHAASLVASWFSDWRDSLWTNNGFIATKTSAGSTTFSGNSTEGASNQPTVDINYTSGGSVPVFMHHYRRLRS